MSHLWPDCRNPKAIDRLPTAVRDTSALAQPNYTEGASDIKISLGDEPEFQARIVGKDPETDIALRKVDEKNLPVLPLGESRMEPGDLVLRWPSAIAMRWLRGVGDPDILQVCVV